MDVSKPYLWQNILFVEAMLFENKDTVLPV